MDEPTLSKFTQHSPNYFVYFLASLFLFRVQIQTQLLLLLLKQGHGVSCRRYVDSVVEETTMNNIRRQTITREIGRHMVWLRCDR